MNDHKLLIDKNCPLCKLYSKGFECAGLIEKDTASFYQTVDNQIIDMIDAERAKSEVALVNVQNRSAVYGAQAFVQILTQNKPWLRKVMESRFVFPMLLQLYRFISYNRHVMAGPHESTGVIERDCSPPVNKTYRWIYIFFGAILTGVIVNQFAFALNNELGLSHSYWREFYICFGQVAWQYTLLSFLDKSKRLDYLGNMTSVSIFGGILLSIFMLLDVFIDFSWFQLLIGFGVIVSRMLWMHIKRSKRLKLPLLVSVSWVIYRSTVLIIILINLNHLL